MKYFSWRMDYLCFYLQVVNQGELKRLAVPRKQPHVFDSIIEKLICCGYDERPCGVEA